MENYLLRLLEEGPGKLQVLEELGAGVGGGLEGGLLMERDGKLIIKWTTVLVYFVFLVNSI